MAFPPFSSGNKNKERKGERETFSISNVQATGGSMSLNCSRHGSSVGRYRGQEDTKKLQVTGLQSKCHTIKKKYGHQASLGMKKT